MARADLLKKLVESSLSGNNELLKKTVLAIIAEEKNKQHSVIADELQKLLTIYSHPEIKKQFVNLNSSNKDIQSLVTEIIPKKELGDLFLEEELIKVINSVIDMA